MGSRAQTVDRFRSFKFKDDNFDDFKFQMKSFAYEIDASNVLEPPISTAENGLDNENEAAVKPAGDNDKSRVLWGILVNR